jgi:hypothetical protein
LTGSEYNNPELSLKAEDGAKFNEYADKIYKEGYTIHRRWALFVKKTDEDSGSNKTWGIEGGIGRDSTQPILSWATTVYDGLLNTRMHDKSSIKNEIWFSENAFGIDPYAYDRWVKLDDDGFDDPWENIIVDGLPVSENQIENLKPQFRKAYEQLWSNESAGSAMESVGTDEDMGILDWYVPSLVEMNHIHLNQDVINTEGFEKLNGGDYWTSTTGLVGAENANSSSDLEINDQYNVDSWTKEQKYRVGSSLFAYTQKFDTSSPNNGSIQSKRKSSGQAKVRLVKRIPIYVVSKYCYTPDTYPVITNCNFCGSCPCGGEQIV